MQSKDMILFDGYCVLCSGTARFIKKNDRRHRFHLVPIQGEEGSKVMASLKKSGSIPDTVILIRKGAIHIKSDAVLRIAARLRFPWPLFSVFFIIPGFIRDAIYDLVAKKRKKWFGERDTCYLPE